MHICCTVLFKLSSCYLLKTVTLLDPSLPSVARVTTGFLFFIAKRKRKEREEEGLSDETFTQFPLSQKWERKKTTEMRKEENKNKCNRDLTRSIEKEFQLTRKGDFWQRLFFMIRKEALLIRLVPAPLVSLEHSGNVRGSTVIEKSIGTERGWNSWLLKLRRYTVCLLLFSSC